jgi:hypothetical protein
VKKHVVAGILLLAGVLLFTAHGPEALAFISGRNGLGITTPVPADQVSVLPGQVLWTHYETVPPFDTCPDPEVSSCSSGGNGDAVLRLINPNGSANSGLAGEADQTVCAMIYVFDNDQEMGECCGCPLSSAKLGAFSVKRDLLSNFIQGGENDFGNGAIAIVASDQNSGIMSFVSSQSNGQGCIAGQSGACNFGCDPTNFPGYAVSSDSDLLGSMTHNAYVETTAGGTLRGLTESNLSDDGLGDENNLLYLQFQCGVLVGNGSGAGTCNCPTELQSADTF